MFPLSYNYSRGYWWLNIISHECKANVLALSYIQGTLICSYFISSLPLFLFLSLEIPSPPYPTFPFLSFFLFSLLFSSLFSSLLFFPQFSRFNIHWNIHTGKKPMQTSHIGKPSLFPQFLVNIEKVILERNRMHVRNVGKPLLLP